MANARKIAQNALLRVERDGAYSNLVLDAALTAAGADPRDAALAAALFYGVLERRLTLDHIIAHYVKRPDKIDPSARQALYLGLYQLLYMDRVPPAAAVNESVMLVRRSRAAHCAGLVNGVLRGFLRDDRQIPLPPETAPFERMAVTYSVPAWLAEHFVRHYGEENARALMASFAGRRPLTLRVNTCKTDRDGLAASLAAEGLHPAPCPVDDDLLTLPESGDITQTAAYQQGLFHVQDAASALCCRAVAPQPGERVLDLCAAPGGKSFTMAQLMQNTGLVLACDLYPQKAQLIRAGAQRLGLTAVQTAVNDATQVDPALGMFDAILCDLPCSGLGILGRKPEIRYKTVTLLDKLPDLQYGMLCNSLSYLKPGGRLIFSTCTLNPAENQQNLARLLAQHSQLRPLPVLPHCRRALGEPEHMITLLPHIHGTDGFFIGAVRKDG